MKRYFSLLLTLLLLLPGCEKKQDEPDNTTDQDAAAIAEIMLAAVEEQDEVLNWYRESSDVDSYIRDYYNLEDADLLDGAVVRMEGARAFELAVLQLEDTGEAVETLQDYLLSRKGSFVGYLPDQEALVDSALILTKGGWVALVVCQDPAAAEEAFERCFDSGGNAQGIRPEPDQKLDPRPEPPPEEEQDPEPPPDQTAKQTPEVNLNPEVSIPQGRRPFVDPGKDDMTLFDNSAILAAWERGDDSTLSESDKQVLDAAKAVLDQFVTSDMSSYDKELALYVWLIQHVDYDRSHYDPQGSPRTAYEPYGPLIHGKGVCLGYASTFQLLMDMVGVECITVTGGAFFSRENHAWNMVRLNGEWYCVDATWDHGNLYDRTGKLRYFNVTSDYMAQSDHQWDYVNVPEATAEDGGLPGT